MAVVLRPRALAAAVLVATLGCGGTSSADAPAQGSGAAGASGSERSQDAQRSVVTIKGFEFLTPTSVAPGEKITIRNDDAVTHTFTAHGDAGFDITVEAGRSVTFVAPHTSGRYDLVCNLHPSMSGVLTVR